MGMIQWREEKWCRGDRTQLERHPRAVGGIGSRAQCWLALAETVDPSPTEFFSSSLAAPKNHLGDLEKTSVPSHISDHLEQCIDLMKLGIFCHISSCALESICILFEQPRVSERDCPTKIPNWRAMLLGREAQWASISLAAISLLIFVVIVSYGIYFLLKYFDYKESGNKLGNIYIPSLLLLK